MMGVTDEDDWAYFTILEHVFRRECCNEDPENSECCKGEHHAHSKE